MTVYRQALRQSPREPLILFTVNHETLDGILLRGSFKGAIYQGSPLRYLDNDYRPIITNVDINNLKVVRQRSLNRRHMEKQYPSQMHFYLYGTADQQYI